MIDLSRDGDIHVITMNHQQNQVGPDFLRAIHAALDEVETEADGPGAIVLTGSGKFFNNGLDISVVMGLEGEDARGFGTELFRLLNRLLSNRLPIVAALNGHAFAAGAMIAMACDYRVMREDRGWICISEVDVGVPIAPPMMALLRAKLPAKTLRDAVLTGKRYDAHEAIASGFVDASAPEAELLSDAKKLAAELATKERGIFGELKKTLWFDLARGFAPSEVEGS